MNYISTVQAAKRWGISVDRINKLIKAGRIPEAVQIGYHWMIPDNTTKPLDARRKEVKKNRDDIKTFFRYPLFEGRDIDSFNPPLSEVELLMKIMGEAYHACKYEEAEDILNKLFKQDMNIYNRISVLYYACMVYFTLDKTVEFLDCYGNMLAEINKIPHYKNEMSTLPNELDMVLGLGKYFVTEFTLEEDYLYHESYLPHLANLCILSLSFSDTNTLNNRVLQSYELLCSSFTNQGCYVDLQSMHFYLGFIYGSIKDFNKMAYHHKKAFDLAYKYNLYFLPALLYFYYSKIMDNILSYYPKEFVENVVTLSNDLHKRYTKFIESTSHNSIYNLLESKDYIYVFYARKGYSNKEVGNLLGISEGSVGNRYSIIYQTLGINNKTELIEYYNNSILGNLNQ